MLLDFSDRTRTGISKLISRRLRPRLGNISDINCCLEKLTELERKAKNNFILCDLCIRVRKLSQSHVQPTGLQLNLQYVNVEAKGLTHSDPNYRKFITHKLFQGR